MTIDQKKTYAVKLKTAVKLGAFRYRPLNEIEMAGTVLAAIIDEHGEDVIDYAHPR